MMEHLLERISLTRYKDCFILKGGMLISAHVGIALRSTLDMDATIKGFPLEMDALQKMIDVIIMIEMDDGIHYKLYSIENIHEDSEYNGYRLSLTAFLDESRIPLKIDITAGDRITPKEIEFDYPMLLEKRSIHIFSYNLETVLAEKLETILSRSIANTRMRDYYDIYILTEMKWHVIQQDIFRSAFSETCKSRGSQNVLNEIFQNLAKIHSSTELEHSWQIYQQRYEFAREISFADVCSSLEKITYPIKVEE
jgi:predicted nucleotidyltransferase component of viral defense system